MSSTATFPAVAAAVPASGAADPQLEYERFDVYRVALEFQEMVPGLFPRRGYAALRDQMDRASSSILLNVAEGAGRFARAEKATSSASRESRHVQWEKAHRGKSQKPRSLDGRREGNRTN